MAKTYTLNATSVNAGWRSSWSSAAWENYSSAANLNESLRVPYVGKISWNSTYRAVNILFDSSKLSELRGKTVTSIKLTVTVVSGTLYANSSNYPIGYKLNSSATDWARSDSGSSAQSATAYAGHLSTSSKIDASNTSVTVDLGTTVPKYGYVIGLNSSSLNMYIQLATSATLTVVTNETDYTYTLSYNANNGSGAPSAQSKTVTASSAPSMTFTISSTKPTRTGYNFLGWSTSSTATSASYQPGGSISISQNTVLYAVWQLITYTISYNANGGSGAPSSQTKTYGVNLTLSSTKPTRTGYNFLGWSTSSTATSATYSAGGTYTANAGATLYAVWEAAASTISASNGTIGSELTITVNKQSSSYTDTITYSFGNVSGTIVTKSSSSTIKWTPANSLAAQIPNATSGVCTLTTTTYSGDTAVGSASISITLSVPESMVPSISSVTLTEAVSGIASKFGAFINGKSRIDVSVTASGVQNSTISSCAITINGQTLNGTSVTTDYLNASGSNNYSVRVIDSRGRAATSTGSFTVLDYGVPSATISALNRSSSMQTTVVVEYTWNIYALNDNNDKSIKIEYKNTSDSTWITADTITPSSYSGNGSYSITGLSEGSSYSIRITVTDYFGSNSYSGIIKPTDSWVMDVDPEDGSIGFHMEAQGDGNDHFGKPVRFEDDVTIDGVLDVTQRRCYADLPSTGWYRVLTISEIGNAGWGFIIDLNIVRAYDHGNNEVHSVKLQGIWNNFAFVDEASRTNYFEITKIRYTKDSNNTGHVDIYYDYAGTNFVSVDFAVHATATRQDKFVAESLQAVADAPSGETILTEYSFNANGTGDMTVNGVLDITQRRCYATLSSAGWYRVCTTRDISGTIIEFNIGRPYGANAAEAHQVLFYIVGGGKSSFVDETSISNTLGVDKIRAVYGGGVMHFDVHYSLSTSNEVLVYFDVRGKGEQNGTTVSNGLQAVADAPSGETVLTTYEFQATNGERVSITPTIGSSHGNYGGCFYEKIGELVHLHLGLSGLTAGSQQTVYTMPQGLRPDMPVAAGGFGANMSIFATGRVNNTGTVNVQIASNQFAMIDLWYIAKQ